MIRVSLGSAWSLAVQIARLIQRFKIFVKKRFARADFLDRITRLIDFF
ncbi:MAG: hypothetical protein KAW12_15565 [Candidatus Aminicenantes bacterium]|nr:hypothetical protein [Candidatus Aminicenantes bacterium]